MSSLLRSVALIVATLPIAALAQISPAPAPQGGHLNDGVARMEKAPVPPSRQLIVTFEGRNTTLSVADLQALPQTTVHVHNAHANQDETYTGPLVAEVLARAGLSSTRETQPLILHSAVIATGTDHYFVLYSAAEVQPSFSKGQVIVALMKNGLPDTDGGLLQLINTDGAKPARWVHGLASLNVVSMTARQ